ncbi:hypothetical protein PR048_026602 [Dryococelus australis]|uniref:Uncharacterized protein n=1 Tax=Dryococelus australis TaxID=614101 RepID=A0ABQ9GLS5_9NEOP|nr:hypothetical protein PR048_026602 [Dryococelus australis]
MFQIAGLLGEAYEQTAVISTAANGFKKSGVWPVDRAVFTDQHFVASDILNQDIEVENDPATYSPQEVIAPIADAIALTPTTRPKSKEWF